MLPAFADSIAQHLHSLISVELDGRLAFRHIELLVFFHIWDAQRERVSRTVGVGGWVPANVTQFLRGLQSRGLILQSGIGSYQEPHAVLKELAIQRVLRVGLKCHLVMR